MIVEKVPPSILSTRGIAHASTSSSAFVKQSTICMASVRNAWGIPAKVSWIDTLGDSRQKLAAKDANRSQTQGRESKAKFQRLRKVKMRKKLIGCPPGIRTPICRSRVQISPYENKGAKCDQSRQNTHTGRTRKEESGL